MKLVKFLILGSIFGIVLTKAEVLSWYRIQEMFMMDAFHMYGVIGSAIFTGLISLQIIKRFKIKSITGEAIELKDKTFSKGNIYGGFIFGLGWAITGACPGPVYTLIGNGYSVLLVTLISALFGTWVYSFFREKLPH